MIDPLPPAPPEVPPFPPSDLAPVAKKLRYEMRTNGTAVMPPVRIIEVDTEEQAVEMARQQILKMTVKHGIRGAIYVYPMEIKQVVLRPILAPERANWVIGIVV